MALASTSDPLRRSARRPPRAARASRSARSAWSITLWRNPLEVWSRAHFEQPVLIGQDRSWACARSSTIPPRCGACFSTTPPITARTRCNCACCVRGSARDCSPSTARPGARSGARWRRCSRRARSPISRPRCIASRARAVERLRAGRDGRVARRRRGNGARRRCKCWSRRCSAKGWRATPSEFQRAVTRYFDTFGRLDPLDLIGAPQFLPRFGRLRGARGARASSPARSTTSSPRASADRFGRARAPTDLLTLLLRAPDPETGPRRSARTTCAPTSSPSSAPGTRRPRTR